MTILRENGDFVFGLLGEIFVVELFKFFKLAQIFFFGIFLFFRKKIVSFRLLRKGGGASKKAKRDNGESECEEFEMCYAGERVVHTRLDSGLSAIPRLYGFSCHLATGKMKEHWRFSE